MLSTSVMKAEYEVYLLKDHLAALKVLKKFKESILFVNIDERLEPREWQKYIKGITEDPALQGVRIGVVSYNDNRELAQRYLLDLMIQGGYVKLTLGRKRSTQIILKALQANEARGRRKHLRAKCLGHTQSSLSVEIGGRTHSGTIEDISKMGMFCTLASISLPVHSRIPNIQLRLGGIVLPASGIVERVCGPLRRQYLILFDNQTPEQSRERIRDFVSRSLRSQVEAIMHRGGRSQPLGWQ